MRRSASTLVARKLLATITLPLGASLSQKCYVTDTRCMGPRSISNHFFTVADLRVTTNEQRTDATGMRSVCWTSARLQQMERRNQVRCKRTLPHFARSSPQGG